MAAFSQVGIILLMYCSGKKIARDGSYGGDAQEVSTSDKGVIWESRVFDVLQGHRQKTVNYNGADRSERRAAMRTEKPIAMLLGIAIVMLVVLSSIGLADCSNKSHAEHFGGSEYTVSAHVDAADRWFTRFWSYDVKLTTAEVLPDGSHLYTSSSSDDWEKLKAYEGQDVIVTIGLDGFVKEVSG